jgi:Arc/MetJ-type ribon-helix-helix transcriptional regulator
MSSKAKYSSVSLPVKVLEEMDGLIKKLGYWPSRGAFVREAILEKMRRERDRSRNLEALSPGD